MAWARPFEAYVTFLMGRCNAPSDNKLAWRTIATPKGCFHCVRWHNFLLPIGSREPMLQGYRCFPKYFQNTMWIFLQSSSDGFWCNAIWGLEGNAHSTEVSCPAQTEIWIPWIFSLYYMVDDERPKYFAICIVNIDFLNCLTSLLWNLTQSVEPCPIFAVGGCSFCNQTQYPHLLSIHLLIVGRFNFFLTYSVIFLLLFCLCPNFWECCSHQNLSFVYIYKIQLIWSVKT